MAKVIDQEQIGDILKETKNPSFSETYAVITKAEEKKGLSQKDTAVLLNCQDEKIIKNIFDLAKKIKNDIYGERLVLFAPLYVSNACNNNCLYCGFRQDNKNFKRTTLNFEEIEQEVRMLESRGHKRVLLVSGEAVGFDYLQKAIKTVYQTKNGTGEIRRVNVNCAPLTADEFKELKKCGIGTYQLFQETYHRPTYTKMHPSGPKADYNNRISAIDRAIAAGIDDVGIGVLFGLYDYRFEILGLLSHIAHLEKNFGIGPHTISVPRLEPAAGSVVSVKPPYPVSDQELKKIVAILRLAVPYTGIILSTRENKELRNELFSFGVSQISAGSSTQPGGYSKEKGLEQFSLSDKRSMSEVIIDVLKLGYLPSFCTACYRLGRTGEDFMAFAKKGEIHKFCLPNCLLTFSEYLTDYATKEEKILGDKVIREQMEFIPLTSLRRKIEHKLDLVQSGKRDLYF
ncbi:MAG: [FeFe] hydrogenase H-cluster radical SAM maturase HydG [Candidatus Omnitrophota bacterium]